MHKFYPYHFEPARREGHGADAGPCSSVTRDDTNNRWLISNTCNVLLMVTFNVGTRPNLVYRLIVKDTNRRTVSYRGTDNININAEANWDYNYGADASHYIVLNAAPDGTGSGAEEVWFASNTGNQWACLKIGCDIVAGPLPHGNGYLSLMLPPNVNNVSFLPVYWSPGLSLLSARFDDADYTA